MIRQLRLVSPLMLGLAGSVAVAQTPGGSVPAPSVPAPHPAHSDGPPPGGGTKANPADAASPPLADPLKQQAVTDPPQSLATPAVQFITQASMDSLTEIQMAQVALERSRNSTVRRLARRVLDDYKTLEAQLETLAAQKGTSVPTKLDSDHAGVVQRLSATSVQAFDDVYAMQFRSTYERVLPAYGAASTLADVEVSRFAKNALPLLRAHQAQAKTLYSRTPHPN